jgi:hypothetical protein
MEGIVIVRGLLISASGFLFIFAPGLVIGLLRRHLRTYNRGLLYWGIGAWIVAQIPAILIQTAIYGAAPDGGGAPSGAFGLEGLLLAMLGASLTAIFVEGALYLALRFNRPKEDEIIEGSLYLGFGSTLLIQVFVGLQLIGAGLPVIFGDTSGPVARDLAESTFGSLVLGLLALIAFRAALPAVRGAIGYLIGQALSRGFRFFWLALAVDVLFTGLLFGLQMALGATSPGELTAGRIDLLGSLVSLAYYLAALVIGYRWLQSRVGPEA